MKNPQAVLLLGHADPESFNHRLAAAYCAGFIGAGGQIERFVLSDLDFDPVLRTGFRAPQPLEPDLLRARTAIEASPHLVWVFPTYWAAPPAIVRGFFDRVFLPGWAFRYEKGSVLPRQLLTNKSARVILTMDSPGWWYTLHYNVACIAASEQDLWPSAAYRRCDFQVFTTCCISRRRNETLG